MVSVFPYLRYALNSVVRNHRKTLTSGLGIMLAVMIILTESLAITLQSRAMMVHEMEQLDSHYFISSTTRDHGQVEQMAELIEELQGIDGISRYFYSVSSASTSYQGYEGKTGVLIGQHTRDLSNFIHTYYSAFNDNLPSGDSRSSFFSPFSPVAPARGTVDILQETATANNLSSGDALEVSLVSYTRNWNYQNRSFTPPRITDYSNLTLKVGRILASEPGSEPYYSEHIIQQYGLNYSHHQFYPFLEPLYFHPLDILSAYRSLEQESRIVLNYYALLDRDIYAKSGISQTQHKADAITEDLDKRASLRYVENRLGFWVDTGYEGAIEGVWEFNLGVQLILFALTIPLMIIGVYIAHLGSQLFLRERRRELGMLKVRGATSGQVSWLLNLESVLIGVVAAGLGIFLAVVGVKLFMPYTQAGDYLSELPWYATGLGWFNVGLGLFLGIFLMWASSYRAFRRMARVEAAELLANFSRTEQTKEYRAKWDLGLLTITTLFVLIFSVVGFDESISYGIQNVFLEILVVVFIIITPVILVLAAPYIYLFSIVRLATRWSTRPYGFLVDKLRRYTEETHELVQRFVVGGERRVSNVTKVLAITMGFLVFTSTFYYAEMGYEERLIRSETGSDIQIRLIEELNDDQINEYQKTLMNLSGIERTSPMQVFHHLALEDQASYKGYRSFDLMLVDAKNYSRITYFDKALWVSGDAGSIEELAGHGDRGVITKRVAKRYHLSVGDRFPVFEQYRNATLAGQHRYADEYLPFGYLKVTGIIEAFPGAFSNTNSEWEDNGGSTNPQILMDRAAYREARVTFISTREGFEDTAAPLAPTRFLVKLEEGAEAAVVTESLKVLESDHEIDRLRNTARELDDIHNAPTTESWLMMLKTQLLAIIYMSFLVAGTIVYIASLDRQNEMANIQLKGTTSRQVKQLQMTEGVVVLTYSLLVGIIAGAVGAAAWINIMNQAENTYDELIITRSLLPSLSQVPALFIMSCIVLVTYYLVCRMFIRTDLTRFIRLRSG